MREYLSSGTEMSAARSLPTLKQGISLPEINKILGGALIALFAYYAISAPTLFGLMGAMMVTAAAVIPTILWINGHVRGMPCFPLFSMLYTVYFATPLVIGHPAVELYSDEEKIAAASTVAGFLLVTTLIWAIIARSRTMPKAHCLIFDARKQVRSHMLLLAVSAAFVFNTTAGIVNLPQTVVSAMRPFVMGLGLISIFLLAFNFGSGELSRWQKAGYLTLLSFVTLANCLTLLLISSITCLLAALAGYWLSARRIPIAATIIVCVFLVVFQAGKYEMRAKYIDQDGFLTVSAAEYPAYFADWTLTGVQGITGSRTVSRQAISTDVPEVGLLARASLMHMLLLTQTLTPAPVPFVNGDTYLDIPQLLLPRFLFPDKPTSHDAMARLSTHYGVLSVDIEQRTSIAWGLLPEAYANFGLVGCFGLALLMGIFFGMLARLSWGYTVFSLRSICSIMVMVCVFGMESHAAAAVSTLFQSLVAVALAGILFSRRGINTGSEF